MNSRRKEWSETWRQEQGNAGLRQSVTVKQRDRELDIHLWDSVWSPGPACQRTRVQTA